MKSSYISTSWRICGAHTKDGSYPVVDAVPQLQNTLKTVEICISSALCVAGMMLGSHFLREYVSFGTENPATEFLGRDGFLEVSRLREERTMGGVRSQASRLNKAVGRCQIH